MAGGLQLFKDTEFNFQHKTYFKPFGKDSKDKKKISFYWGNKGVPPEIPPHSYATAYSAHFDLYTVNQEIFIQDFFVFVIFIVFNFSFLYQNLM